jgi:hypothetical protein
MPVYGQYFPLQGIYIRWRTELLLLFRRKGYTADTPEYGLIPGSHLFRNPGWNQRRKLRLGYIHSVLPGSLAITSPSSFFIRS